MSDGTAHIDETGGIRLVQVTGKCPHCEVRKHQISGTKEHAMQVVSDAIAHHVAEAHPEHASSPGETA